MQSARLGLVFGTAITMGLGSAADAQILDRLERRVERNARQLQRQVNRADYYSDQTWNSVDPWVRENNVTPLGRAANAVRNTVDAVANTVDVAEDRVDARFGFDNNNRDQRWFYDYYTYTPTYYYRGDNDDRYASAIRYFDADNDGVYDSQSTYRDSDRDGRYDEYDRVDFYVNNEKSDNNQSETRDDVRDARRHRMQGEIAMTKSARVNGSDHLIVGLKGDNEKTVAIDLGSADALRGRDVEVGASIVAIGTLQDVGKSEVLIAESLQIGNGEKIEIERHSDQQISGQIVDVRETKVGSTQHYMAIVEVDGERQLMDLGPTETFKAQPEANAKIVVRGVPVRARGHRLFLANRVRLNGQEIEIDRAKSFTF